MTTQGRYALVVLGQGGLGKSTLLSDLFTEFNKSAPGDSDTAVTKQTVQQCIGDWVVFDTVGDGHRVANLPAGLHKYSAVCILVLVVGRCEDEFQKYREAYPTYKDVMICVRSYFTRGKGNIGIYATDISAIRREIELRKRHIRIDTAPNGEHQRALANNASARSKGKSQPARRKLPFLVNVKLRSLPRLPTPCQVNVASLGLTRDKISEGRAIGDAILLVMLRQNKLDDNFKSNDYLVRFLEEMYPQVKQAIQNAYPGEEISNSVIGDGLEYLFQTTKNDHGRILLNEYKCWCER